MNAQKRIVDDIDLRISLTPGLLAIVPTWMERLSEHHDHTEVDPKVRKNKLLINSTDLVSLIGYISPNDVSELELRRFLSLSKNALEQALLRATSIDSRNHYKWCLTAVKSFQPGRFLHPDEEE